MSDEGRNEAVGGEVDDELRAYRRLATVNQIVGATNHLDLAPEEFVRFPWPSLDELTGGGLAPGEIWFMAAFSGNGKTAMTTSLIAEWGEVGERVYVMGLESSPAIMRTHWACRRLGINPGAALSGKLRETPEGQAQRELLKAELRAQFDRPHIQFSDAQFINRSVLRDELLHAADIGSRVVLIDHIDHVQPDKAARGNLYAESVATLNLLVEMTVQLELRVVSTSQLNNNAVRGDRIEQFLPPRPEAVYLGPNKRMIATGMLGLYRPLRPDLTEDDFKLLRTGRVEPLQMVQPNRMGVVLMKDRRFGLEGKRCLLEVRNGKVGEISNEWWR